MKIIEKVEEELLGLTTEERLASLKEISYFLQSVAQVMKARPNSDAEDISIDVLKTSR